MKLGEVVVTHVYYNITNFHQNSMKNKKVLLIARFSVQNFKVSVLLSFYVVYTYIYIIKVVAEWVPEIRLGSKQLYNFELILVQF